MSTMQRETTGERRLPTPSWAVNDKELQHLLVVFMEVRACFRKHKDFPLNENKKDRTPEALKSRLQKATEEVLARRAGQLAAMEKIERGIPPHSASRIYFRRGTDTAPSARNRD